MLGPNDLSLCGYSLEALGCEIPNYGISYNNNNKTKKRFGNLHFMSFNGMTKVLIMGFPTKKCFVNLHSRASTLFFNLCIMVLYCYFQCIKTSETSIAYEENNELVLYNCFYV